MGVLVLVILARWDCNSGVRSPALRLHHQSSGWPCGQGLGSSQSPSNNTSDARAGVPSASTGPSWVRRAALAGDLGPHPDHPCRRTGWPWRLGPVQRVGRAPGRRERPRRANWAKVKQAAGLCLAGARYRGQDWADAAWRPVDAILRSRTRSNLCVLVPTACAADWILRHNGTIGVLHLVRRDRRHRRAAVHGNPDRPVVPGRLSARAEGAPGEEVAPSAARRRASATRFARSGILMPLSPHIGAGQRAEQALLADHWPQQQPRSPMSWAWTQHGHGRPAIRLAAAGQVPPVPDPPMRAPSASCALTRHGQTPSSARRLA